ncbi:MAG: SWI/SNF-related matrix-associated actin-dependent regulator 1 of chromatin subfamily A [Planctomycetota bacterium]
MSELDDPPPLLTEPRPGLFVLAASYEQREIAKEAGFRWHRGDRCRVSRCPACREEVGKAWISYDEVHALMLVEYADAELTTDLQARAADEPEDRAAAAIAQERSDAKRHLRQAQSLQASLAQDADIHVPAAEGFEYLPYQRAAIAYALSRRHTLIADEMGLGKTIEALGVINADLEVKRVLVVCPASLKLNWQRECERWLTRGLRAGVTKKKWPADVEVVITNYEVLGKWAKELKGVWDLLIADECHFVKNRHAKRSKRLFALKAKRRLFLTGTPVLNRPMEIQTVAASLDPESFGNFWDFAKRYCDPKKGPYGWDFNGATNLEELHMRLRSTIMIRRTKADVLSDLPPKRRQVIELSAEGLSKVIKSESAAWREHKQRLDELRRKTRTDDGRGYSEQELQQLREGVNAAFGELAKLRQATALAKVPLVLEHLNSVLEETEKVVVFAHHRAVVKELAEAFGERAVTLTGGMSLNARQEAVDRFQDDDTVHVFVGSITAAGFGLTLTAASHVVFAELDWVPAHLSQAEDRTHRLGQDNSVLVQHLVLEDSIDARMVRTLIHKQRIVDGVTDIPDPQGRQDMFSGEYAESLMRAAEEEAQREKESPKNQPSKRKGSKRLTKDEVRQRRRRT